MAIASLLRQTATVQNPSGTDMHNKPTLSVAVSYPVRFEQTYKIIATATLEQIPIIGTIYFAPDADVQNGAKIIYNGVSYRAVSVSEIVNARGKLHHLEVNVQNWNL